VAFLPPADNRGAAGIVVDDRLVAVTAWCPSDSDREVWWSGVLAVDPDYRGRRYGLRLKVHLLGEAERAGVRSVVSLVAFDNEPMLRLNAKLGGFKELRSSGATWLCTVPVG